MVAPIRPNPIKAFGTEKWVFVPTLASITAPSTATLTGGTSLDVTKMFFATSNRPDASTNMVTAEKRIGDIESFEFAGETHWTLGEVQYQFDPQSAAASNGKKAFEKFPAGTTGFLVRRLGMNRDTDLAVAQFVSVFPVECGVQVESVVGEGETAEVAIKQAFAVTSTPSINVALAA
jgi:hypothetical protein